MRHVGAPLRVRSWHLLALGERIRAGLARGLLGAGFLLFLLGLAPSPANAQDSPGVTLASEWRCEKAVSAAMAARAAKAARIARAAAAARTARAGRATKATGAACDM